MELMDQSEKTLYDKCKFEVKLWEHNFKKTNGRLPSRLDIKEANSSVRDAYRTYFRLKTAALEKSFMGIEGFYSDEEQPNCETNNTVTKSVDHTDENCAIVEKPSQSEKTWGSHLNKKPIKKSHSEPLKPAANLNQKFVSKLSVGSKLVKRNPRKSLSQSKHNSSSSIDKPTTDTSKSQVPEQVSFMRSFSQPIELEANSQNLTLELGHHHQFNTQKMKILSSNYVAPKSLNIINDLMEKKVGMTQKLREVDMKWLERVQTQAEMKITDNQITKVDCVSDEDIIDNSDDESSCSSHVAKRFKYSNPVTPSFKILSKQNIISEKLSNTPQIEVVEEVIKEVDEPIGHDGPNISSTERILPSSEQNKSEANASTSTKENRNDKIVDEERDEAMNRFKKKNLNENFVRINMKKKVYARGKKKMNFSTYKRNMWKSRKKFMEEMEADSQSSTKKFAKLMPLEVYASIDEENTLVSLDEASGIITPHETLAITESEMEMVEKDSDDDIPLAQIKKTISTTEAQIKPKATKPQSKSVKKKSPKAKNSQSRTQRKTLTKSKKLKTEIENENEEYIDDIETENTELEQSNKYFNDDDDFNLLLESIRIENTIDLKGVYPLYSCQDDGSLIETPPQVYDALRLFGHESFREGQETAVMRILSGKSTLVTSSTGSGKSLCYQLPAYLFRQKYRCISLVISPLISLMEDQIKCMPAVLNAVCLHGNQTKTQRDAIIKSLTDGNVSILMVSPESILSCDYSSGFGSILARIPPIAFACLDEAHCLSQWSHNFRPSYLVVCQILQEKLGIKTILGLTATATQSTRNSLIQQLQIPDGENGVIKDTPIPSNLKLTVSRDMNREQALLELLHTKPFVDFTSIIIYCLRRNDCDKVAAFLRASLKDFIPATQTKKRKRVSSQVEAYHAGLSGARRKTIQNAFTSGDLRIVVATVAFGMGINKSDIRSVIHYNMPANFESYVQEIGRAGRDRLPAHCHIFMDRQHADVYELRRHIYGNSVDRYIIRKLLRKVFIPCKCEGTCIKHEIMFSVDSTVGTLDIPQEVISTLLCYLELHERKYIKVLKQSYGKCKIVSYAGSAYLHKTALTCEPLKYALKINESDKENTLEFSILKVAKQLNYDTGICKQVLKNLEWTNVSGQPKRTALNVEFSDLSFHLLSPGNLPDEDLDEVLDTLYNKVLNQENIAYAQLIDIDQTLSKVALPTCKNLEETEEKSESLKKDIRDYFECKKCVDPVEIPEITDDEKNVIIRDIRLIVDRYGDANFTGRSIARIFHGIASPNFQPREWGRTKFWRAHLKVHFNTICKLATSELIRIHS